MNGQKIETQEQTEKRQQQIRDIQTKHSTLIMVAKTIENPQRLLSTELKTLPTIKRQQDNRTELDCPNPFFYDLVFETEQELVSQRNTGENLGNRKVSKKECQLCSIQFRAVDQVVNCLKGHLCHQDCYQEWAQHQFAQDENDIMCPFCLSQMQLCFE